MRQQRGRQKTAEAGLHEGRGTAPVVVHRYWSRRDLVPAGHGAASAGEGDLQSPWRKDKDLAVGGRCLVAANVVAHLLIRPRTVDQVDEGSSAPLSASALSNLYGLRQKIVAMASTEVFQETA